MNSPHTLTRRQCLLGGAGLLSGLPGLGRSATGWQPSQNINYVIGVAPGGSVDLYARGIKQALDSLKLVNGQTVIAENKPGAAGLLALQQLQRNRGNAHHLSTFHTGAVAGQVTGMLKADLREFVPVAMLVEETTLFAVGSDSPLKSAQDVWQALKRDPASLKLAVAPARGLNLHLALAKPLKLAGVDVAKLTVVPFRSSADSMAALLGGHVDLVAATGPTVVPLAQAGKVRMLVSCAAQRGKGPLGEVPTWRELGIAADYASYNGVLLPGGVDAEQIRFWDGALRQVSNSPEWKALVEKSGNKPVFKGYVDSHRYLEAELKETRALVGALGMAAE